ncbi:MAG: acetylglutamate kinase [Kiritimatiellia bacterium]
MKTIIAKARTLVEALPYIQSFREAVVVVKYGGSTMEEKQNSDNILTDLTFMSCVGMRPVIVHGGGKAISRRMKEAGLQAQFVKGLRVTDEATIQLVHEVIQTVINPAIVDSLKEKGARARGIPGEEIFKVIRRVEKDAQTGETFDWGFVGDIQEVNTAPLEACFKTGEIPVITPLGLGPEGALYNLNADDAAAAVARTLKARKLAYLSDVPGLLRDPQDENSIISTLRVRDVEGLVKDGIINGGMLPKIRSAVEAIQAGVRKVHLIDGRQPHSLLLEIYTDAGVGTEIIQND